jgi:hypothetical protein
VSPILSASNCAKGLRLSVEVVPADGSIAHLFRSGLSDRLSWLILSGYLNDLLFFSKLGFCHPDPRSINLLFKRSGSDYNIEIVWVDIELISDSSSNLDHLDTAQKVVSFLTDLWKASACSNGRSIPFCNVLHQVITVHNSITTNSTHSVPSLTSISYLESLHNAFLSTAYLYFIFPYDHFVTFALKEFAEFEKRLDEFDKRLDEIDKRLDQIEQLVDQVRISVERRKRLPIDGLQGRIYRWPTNERNNSIATKYDDIILY